MEIWEMNQVIKSCSALQTAAIIIFVQQKFEEGIIGVCPQYNVLWDTLTISEHILFYGQLRGMPLKQVWIFFWVRYKIPRNFANPKH